MPKRVDLALVLLSPQPEEPVDMYVKDQPRPQKVRKKSSSSLPAPSPFGPQMGVGGLPMAKPVMFGKAENGIRHQTWCCCDIDPGPKVPSHWYDGGGGWVTRYFYDSVPYNAAAYEPGKFRCQVRRPDGQHCNHEVVEDDCCKGNCFWRSGASAHLAMDLHLLNVHGLLPPPKRQWSSGLCDTEGCCDTYFCAPCIGSRMMMALVGHEDEFHIGWCLFFTFLGCRSEGSGRNQVVYWIPPHVYVSIMTRQQMVTLNNIDEGCCTTGMTAICCPLCSMTQTYRELIASGVTPGAYCGDARPATYGTVGYHVAPMMAKML